MTIIICTLALTACGSKTIYVTSTDAPSSMSSEDLFVEFMYEEVGYIINEDGSIGPSDMVETAKLTCKYLQNGTASLALVLEAAMASAPLSTQKKYMRTNITGALTFICPDQYWRIDELG